jgi:TPR repeat protein
MDLHHALALGIVSLPLLACGGASVPVSAAAAEDIACAAAVRGRATPLIVDWAPAERRALQARMATGIAVVAYDCNGIRVLPECSVEGRYGYVGRGPEPQVVQLHSADELRANLPRTGSALLWPALAELSRGASLDLALVTAGRVQTKRGSATAADLVGECAGATHFVRGATLGAFAVDAGARGLERRVPDIFEGGARGGAILSATERRVQGALTACGSARPGAGAPPDGCDAVYRIELAAIETAGPVGAATRPLGEITPDCGGWMVWSDGKCVAPGTEALQVCNTADFADCEAQCNRGEQKSCVALGWMYERGRGAPKSEVRALSLYEGACDRRTPSGCRSLGWLYSEGIGVPKDPGLAASLYQKACDGGDADACSNLGHMYGIGEGVTRDLERAVRLSQKGCLGGDANGCNNLGILDENGWGVPKNPALAADLYRQACDGGSAMGCANLGNLLVRGRGVPVDRAQGYELLRRGCAGGNVWGCQRLQQLRAGP